MTARPRGVLTVNVGSSSLKASLLRVEPDEHMVLRVAASGVGGASATLRIVDGEGALQHDVAGLRDHGEAFDAFVAWLRDQRPADDVIGVGHRVVYGGPEYHEPTVVSDTLLSELRRLVDLDPNHLPQALEGIARARAAFPDVTHVACFDTAFHRTMPDVARAIPLARELTGSELARYGFHGLSYEYVVETLRGEAGDATRGRMVVAHLGSGASMAAIRDGVGVDTTMGFTPAGGLMMGTRSGDLDPGVLVHLVRTRGLDGDALDRAVNRDAGLRGVSGYSSDMRELLDREASDPDVARAVDLYCHTARKHLGGLVAVLGGLDTLVFTAGIGERSLVIRERICAGVEHLGVELDPARNADHAPVISTDRSRVTVRVVPTDEELVVARHTVRLIAP